MQAAGELGELLTRLEQAVAETRSMARTLERSGPVHGWYPAFRDSWIDLLARLGEAISAADVDALACVRADVEEAAHGLFRSDRGPGLGPVHGALLVNLRNIAEAMDVVAGAQPVRPHSLARRRVLPRRRRPAA